MKTILVIDDDNMILMILKQTLTKAGYRVFTVTSGEEGITLLATSQVDLVLTDYTMPLMTGVDLCARIRKIRPDIPLILSSGGTEQITEESLRQDGIDEYLPKPITFQGLAQVVRRALDKK